MTDDEHKLGSKIDVDKKPLDRSPAADPALAQRLEQLKAALRRIRDGDLPCGAELERLPLLDHWAIAIDGPVRLLIGVVSNHPLLDDGWCTTSPLMFISDDRKLARVYSQYPESFPDSHK